MNKYEFTGEQINFQGKPLSRIRALKSFGGVRGGELGGWIEGEWNLSQKGDCWVGGYAKVCQSARVMDNALVSGGAVIKGNAKVYQNAKVSEEAYIWGDAKICGNARVFGGSMIFEEAYIAGNASIGGFAKIYGYAYLLDNVIITDRAELFGNIGSEYIFQKIKIGGNAMLSGLGDEIQICNWHPQIPLIITKYPQILFHCGEFSGTRKEFLRFIGLNLTIF